MPIIAARSNEVDFIIRKRPVFHFIQASVVFIKYNSLRVPVAIGPYGIAAMCIKWIVFRYPGIRACDSAIGLCLKAEYLAFIRIDVLCMVGAACVIILTGSHIAHAIKKIILIVDRRYNQSPAIMVVAAGDRITNNNSAIQGMCVRVIGIPFNTGTEKATAFARQTTYALLVGPFKIIQVGYIYIWLPL
ncbi:hypothetical protein FLA_4935 [Filimonas lacunae]|nr:hypothetical protein FLA_4935 [Filimonas lacunae]